MKCEIYKILILTMFFISNLVACKDKKVVEAENILKEWIGKTVEFPNIKPIVPHTTINIDTINYNKEYKILLYTDSTGCTSYKLGLYKWKIYMEELKDKVDFMFYFHPKTEKELLLLLKNAQFSYHVYIDNNDELNKLNHFPSSMAYQCFLLDKNDKVLIIGNPVHNSKVWELYKKNIMCKISNKLSVTTVGIEQSKMKLKNLQTGNISEAVFTLKNTGTQPLIIQMVDASCGCTIPDWEKHPIKAGQTTEIKVQVTPEEKGYFNKTVTVLCNVKEGQILLTINGMVNN